jgi:hypothetical protein
MTRIQYLKDKHYYKQEYNDLDPFTGVGGSDQAMPVGEEVGM